MNSVIKTEGLEVFDTVEAAGAYMPATTFESHKPFVKAPAGMFKAGDSIPVAVSVVEKIGSGRNAQRKHVGYSSELRVTTGGGKEFFDKDADCFMQNYYF